MKIIFILCLLSFNVLAKDIVLPSSVTKYNFYINGIKVGQIERQLHSLGNNRYRVQSEVHTSGFFSFIFSDSIAETSTFEFKNNVVQSVNYSFHQTGGSKIKHVELSFDWEKNQLKNNLNGKTIPINVPTYDELSYQVAMMFDLIAGNKKLEYAIANENKLIIRKFNLGQKEVIELPIGKMETLVLKMVPESNDRYTTLWYIPSKNYMLGKIHQIEPDGTEFSLELKSESAVVKSK